MRTLYYAALTNRDRIKLHGVPHSLWHFLEPWRQPDGWLISLAYRNGVGDPPGLRIIDCGAWTYRAEAVPKLGREMVTPAWAVSQYAELARAGDAVVAPDHMLCTAGRDAESRQRWNLDSAAAFLPLVAGRGWDPMAVAHGLSIPEYAQSARLLAAIGYRRIAVGGVAGMHSGREFVYRIVRAVRDAVPTARLHVLGLSAPEYFAMWAEMGVDSCDGSSHYKQAFRVGAFFNRVGIRLMKQKAARVGEPITAAECACRACTLLREQGIDTRTYGSNEHNMGRAVHNLGQLIDAQRVATLPTVALVACSSQKRNTLSPAADLYTGDWHKKARAYVEAMRWPWHILSAKWGLLHPQSVVEPYEMTLNAMRREERVAWARGVMEEVAALGRVGRFVVLAGRHYREDLVPLLEASGAVVEVPLEGLGIGEQLQRLGRLAEAASGVKQGTLFEEG